MTVRVRTEWKGHEFTEMVRKAVVTRGLPAAAAVVEGRMKDNLSGPGPSRPGSPPGQDTGQLKQSITYVVSGMTAKIGTNRKYGRYLEYGARISASNVKALPVPVNKRARMLLRRGIANDVVSGSMVSGGLRSSGANLIYIKSRTGRPMLVEATPTGKIKKGGAAFVLKPIVNLAPRPWALRSLNEARQSANAAFTAAVAREVKARAIK